MGQAAKRRINSRETKEQERDMTSINLFGARTMAAFFAVLLSATMVLSSVGPAYNVQAPNAAQDLIA